MIPPAGVRDQGGGMDDVACEPAARGWASVSSLHSPPAPQAASTRLRAPHRVAHQLIERINSGAYNPGSRLPTETELLREFPVSRGALREALTILQCLGLIDPRRRGGTKILGPAKSAQALFDASVDLIALLEACCVFEVETTALAAGLPGEKRLPEAPCGPPDVDRFHQFHVDLARATGNGAVIASIANLWDLALARPTIRALFAAAIARSDVDFARLQGQVTRAVEAGDPGAAGRAVKVLFNAYLDGALDAEEAERMRCAKHDSERLRSAWKRRLSLETRLAANCSAEGRASLDLA
jgi:DNA-binding FadR family transcriptional regulator